MISSRRANAHGSHARRKERKQRPVVAADIEDDVAIFQRRDRGEPRHFRAEMRDHGWIERRWAPVVCAVQIGRIVRMAELPEAATIRAMALHEFERSGRDQFM
jgi:hypothetical protein